MALPTVSANFVPASLDAFAIVNHMPDLQSRLIAKGWTIEWANVDAIGSGSAAAPAWDKAFVANDSAGIAVFRMPLNDHDVAWFVRIEARWTTSGLRLGWYVQAGRVHDGVGNLTEGSPILTTGLPTSNVSDLGYSVAVSEDGFVIFPWGTGTTTATLHVERIRDYTGVVRSDLMVRLMRITTSGYGVSILRSDNGTPYYEQATAGSMGMLGSVQTTSMASWSFQMGAVVGTKDLAGELAFPMGPYFPSRYGLTSVPRLFMFFQSQDAAQDVLVPVAIDGGVKTYRTPDNTVALGPGSALSCWAAVATE